MLCWRFICLEDTDFKTNLRIYLSNWVGRTANSAKVDMVDGGDGGRSGAAKKKL